MPKSGLAEVIRYIHKVFKIQGDSEQTDAELLERFLTRREESAFAFLVERHGPMILSVGQRVLGDSHEAEDVLQATFLVLARRTSSIRGKGSVGGWLHGVAQRIALRARAQGAARRRLGKEPRYMSGSREGDDATVQDLRSALDEEIGSLPEKHRTPIVLCYLEGKSHNQAAKELGCPKSTLESRLTKARELLRRKLERRGITLAVGALATSLTGMASAAPMPALLTIKIVKSVTLVATGKAVAGGCISAHVLALAEEALTGMLLAKGKLAVVVMALGLAVGGAGWAGYKGLAATSKPAPAADAQSPAPKKQADVPVKKDEPVATDQYGDPLPEGAIARLGSMRFRGPSFALAFSRDGKILASAGNSLGVRLWEAATGRLLHRLPFPNSCESLTISADGNAFVAGGDNPCLIDMKTGKLLREYEFPAGRSRWCVALSPDGRTLAGGSGSADLPKVSTTVVLLDVATGQLKRRLKDSDKIGVRTVAFSPDGKLLAAGSDDKTVYLWDLATGKEWRRFGGHEQPVLAVTFAPKGRFLASSDSRHVQLWDLETGLALHTLKAESNPSPLAFSPDGKLLAYAVHSGTVCLCNPQTGKEVRRWAASTRSVHSLAFSPDGKVLVSGGGEGAIRRWDPETGLEIEPDGGHTGGLASLLFAQGGKTFFSGGTDWKVLEWDLASGRQRRQLFAKPQGLPEARWPMSNYALAPDGKILAWTGLVEGDKQPDRIIHLWDVSSEKEIRSLSGHEEQIWSLRFSPDAKHLASSGTDETRLWDVATGRELHFLRQVRGAAFSPDGKFLAGTKKDLKTIGLWEVATGKELRTWDSPDKTVSLVFSPNGKSLAAIPIWDFGENGRLVVRVWDIETGKQVVAFERQGYIDSLAFSPSGRILAAAATSLQPTRKADGQISFTVYLWDALSGEEIGQIHSPHIYSMAFAPNGRILATGGNDSTILLWDVTGRARDGKLPSIALSPKEVDSMWSDLASDAAKAQRTIWTLVLAPKQSIALLKQHMLVTPAPPEKVAKLFADLDSDRFAVRQEAAQALEKMGESAESAARDLLEGSPTLELRQRLSQFLEKREKETPRKLRAMEVLEQIGTPEARQVLEALAVSAANPLAREAAEAALKRLASKVR